MDPLSLIASVTAVLQLTATVVNYLNDVKNASNDQRRFAIEASSLFSLLTGLKYRIEDANLADPWFTRARALAVENGPLSQYKVALERLVTKTIPGNESKKIFADFLWPLRKGEVAEIFATIERLKSLTSIALEMDHFKLSQAINEETKKMPELIANVDVVRRNQEDQESQIIMDWLSATDFSNQQTDLSLKRQEGTGTWFLEMQEFNYWLTGTNTILFCRGDPGTGKTMLSSLVIDHIRNTDNHQLAGVAFLYCDYKKQKEQKPVELLSALLRQLLQGLPLVPNTVKDLYDKHIWKKTRPSLDGILTTIQSILGSYPEVFIIIDALDECADEQRDILLSRLKTLQVPTVKLMITSRRNVGISAEFPNPFIVEIKAHNEDIVRFIQGQIPRLRCVSSRQDLQQHIISTIKDAADGLFILTVLLFESLVGKTTPKAIKLALESMPKGSRALSQAYSDAIERIESQQPGYVILAKEALSWITCARRQLSVKELQHALAVEIGEDQLDEENITDISVIVSVCAGLVTVDEQSNIVRLVHYTAYEHFIESGPSIFPAAHRHIAMICINYLMFETFEAGSCLYQEQFEARLDSHALYDYAARNWGHHARTDSMTQEKLILTFLESKAKVSASVQAIFSRSANWRKPDQVTGMHLAA